MKRIILTSLILLFTVFSLSGQSAAYIDALNKYHQNDRNAAYAEFKRLTHAEPDNDAAFYYLAMTSSDLKETEEAFKNAIALDPENYWYQYHLALFYANTQREELTKEILESLIGKYPSRTSLYYDIINVYLSQNDIDKALETIQNIETKMGKSEATVMTRFELLAKSNKTQDAYKTLEAGYTEVKTPRIACILGDYYAKMYDDKNAMKFYDEALEMDSSNMEAYFAKAHIHHALRQYDLYFENITHVIQNPDVPPQTKSAYIEEIINSGQFAAAFAPQIDTLVSIMYHSTPTDSTVAQLAGIYQYRRGNVDEAIQILKENADRYPDNLNAVFTHTLLLYYSEEWDKVTQTATEALLRFPNNLQLLQIRSIAFFQMKEYDNSLADNLKIVELAPRDSAYLLNGYTAIGDIYHLKGEGKKAFSYFEKALGVNPDYSPVLNNYAYYISEEITSAGVKIPAPKNKKLNKALKMSRKTVEKEPDNATYLDTYAWLLHQMGMDLEAKAHFKHAMLYGGRDSAVILRHYAEVLSTLGEKDLAEIYFRQARNLEGK